MRKLIFILIVSLTIIPNFFLQATIRNVPGSYSTIQSAVNAASNGDTILVEPGVYFENVNFRGKGILLASKFIIYHDTSYVNNTVINGSTPTHNDTASCVIMTKPNVSYASDTSAAIIGFTLTGGRGLLWSDTYFPGYFYREGGGIFIQYWSPRIKYNRIIANTIKDSIHPDGGGGGIRCCDGNPVIENNVIQYNFGYCGMAINFYHASGIIRNNIIAGNYGGTVWGSGAIYTYMNYQTNPTLIENNSIINNTATNGCGGLRLYNVNNETVKNNIVWGNLPGQFTISGCYNLSITYCDVQGGYAGTGNLNLNPQFVTNTYYLNPTSPCVDAGDTSVSNRDPEDPNHLGYALLPALGTVRNDMGAFGGPHCSLIGTSVIGIKNIGTTAVTEYFLFQNYPNPFNPKTTIRFQLKNNCNVILDVYDILGKEIATLVNEKLRTGEYEIQFPDERVSSFKFSSGIFFIRYILMESLSIQKKCY